jgi:hypothetical protein
MKASAVSSGIASTLPYFGKDSRWTFYESISLNHSQALNMGDWMRFHCVRIDLKRQSSLSNAWENLLLT